MNKQDIQSLLEHLHFSPNKRFGQNFLINDQISGKIIEFSKITSNTDVLEIGPGLGSLTSILAEKSRFLTAVEIDNGYAAFLQDEYAAFDNVRIINDDFLKSRDDYSFTHVVANLPYYCSSEMIFRLIDRQPEVITVMLQKELAERIRSKSGSKEYGALTVNISLNYACTGFFLVGKSNFYPRPDVDSAVIRLEKKERPVLETAERRQLFKQLVQTLFWARRKTVQKCLSSSPHIALPKEVAEDVLKRAGVSPLERAEKLDLDDFVAITLELEKEL